MNSHQKITKTERQRIAAWLEEGLSRKEIGRRLGRSTTSISHEITRNSRAGLYEPLHAQAQAESRKLHAWQSKHPLGCPAVYAYTLEHLRHGWSPEQIAGRLRREHPTDASWHICAETIYAFIYAPTNRDLALWDYLRRGHKKRRKAKGRLVHRSRIPDRVSIHDRPKTVEKRIEFGHWEGDSVVGKGRAHGIHTAYERVSSFMRLEYMPHLTADASVAAQQAIYQLLPAWARRTTTLDNGSEHVGHVRLRPLIRTYFADPYSAWQRGGNENANLWIRYYFPKGTDFSLIGQDELQAVEWELNHRPRKRLNYRMPHEVFMEHLLKGS